MLMLILLYFKAMKMDLVQLVIIYMIRFELIWKGGHKTIIFH